MKKIDLTSLKNIPRPTLVAGAIFALAIIALTAFIFSSTSSGEPRPVVTKGVEQETADPAATQPATKETSSSDLPKCTGEKCAYTEDLVYAKARIAAQKIADAQNAFYTIDPNDNSAWEKNSRVMDKYLSGLSSYSIDENNTRQMSTVNYWWFPTKKVAHKWQLPPDTDETKYNAIIDRGITLLCVADDGTILSEVFLGWGDEKRKSDTAKIVSSERYSTKERDVIYEYLRQEYLSFTYYQQIVTYDGRKVLFGD